MQGTWWESIKGRIRGALDVLTGRAYAAYGPIDWMSEARLRMALIRMQERDDRNGSLPPAYRAIIDNALEEAV